MLKSVKKIITVIVAAAVSFTVVFSSIPQAAFAETSESTASGSCGDDLTWDLTDGVLTISGTGDMYDYNSSPFSSYAEEITEVIIEDGVAYIGDAAFQGLTEITDIDMPDSVASIGYRAFYGCTSLASVALSETLTSIGDCAFQKCSSLTKITIPASVASIEGEAFYSCSKLSKVYFDGDAPELGDGVWSSSFTALYYSTNEGWDDAISVWSEEYDITWVDLTTSVSGDEFEITSKVNIETGETAVIETNANSEVLENITWSSSNISVASVSQSGKVRGFNAGTVTVTAQSDDGEYYAECAVTVTDNGAETVSTKVSLSSSNVTDNVSFNNYNSAVFIGRTFYITSYLYENEDGGFTRVETTFGVNGISDDNVVYVEEYSEDLELTGSVTLDFDLDTWGGFYSGEDYNFLVFGGVGDDYDSETEVVRVKKYSKDWELLDTLSISSYYINEAFVAGSACRMTELNGSLYIHASEEYGGHDMNMVLVIDIDSMTLEDEASGYGTGRSGDYCSHSWNQFIQTDGEYIYLAFHGDSYPRAVSISRFAAGDEITDTADEIDAFPISGSYSKNGNYTGVTVGGFELSDENCILVGTSVDQEDYDVSAAQNLFVTVTDKDLTESSTVYLTDYDSDSGMVVCTPQLVKLDSDTFLIMWEEFESDGTTAYTADGYSIFQFCEPITFSYGTTGGMTTKMVLIDGNGDVVSDIYEIQGMRLSDCQPFLSSDGYVTWYTTSNFRNIFLYRIDPYRLSELSVERESIEGATVTSAYKVTLSDGTVLQKGEEYVTSVDSCGNVTATGVGEYTGTATKTGSSHSYESEVTTKATCTEKGVKTYTCSVCGYSYTKTISATGHSYTSEVTTAATCTAVGVCTYTCSDCGDTYTEEIASTGHSYDGNVCETCGALKSSKITAATITLSATSYTYDGTAKKPSVTVKINGTTLASGTDYTVTYKNNTNVGTASVIVTGTGSYSGTQTVTFTIAAASSSSSSSNSSSSSGSSSSSSSGSSSSSKTSISGYTASLSYTSKTYTGSALKPSVTVKTGSGSTLSSSNYTVSYKNNTDAGTATVTIKGTGNYTGTITKTFKIKAQSLSSSNASLSYTSKTYTGSALKPTVKVKNSAGSTLIKNTDYTVSYKNNKSIGTATVTIKGTGNYTGTVTKTFKIVPKKTSISSLKSSKSKTLTVKWKKVSGSVTKYQIRYRVKGTSKWTKVTVSSKKTSTTLKNLKSGKKYEIQVRSYKTVDGKKYVSSWSSVKRKTVK